MALPRRRRARRDRRARRPRPCPSAPWPSRRSRRAGSGSCSPGASAADALPRLAPGVRLPPVLRRVSEFLVSEFALSAGGRVHQAEVKAGFAAAPDYYALDTDPAAAPRRSTPTRVLDVTESRRRATASCGGRRRPATGGPPVRRVPDRSDERPGAAGGDRPGGGQARRGEGPPLPRDLPRPLRRRPASTPCSATASSPGRRTSPSGCGERFRELRGYDPLPWLPALAGYVVGDAERIRPVPVGPPPHDRRPARVASTTARSRTAAHDRGLTYYAEALEDHRPQLGDDLAMRSHADVPMGAMWTFDAGDRPEPTYVADLKGASSVAHVYGKPFTGAESMSAFHRPWSYTPRRLKHVADLELALGVTRFCIHTSPHQPTQVPPPGIGLVALPRPDVHPLRAVGRDGRAVDRLPGPLLVPAQPGRAGGRRGGVHRRGGAADRAVRRRASTTPCRPASTSTT